MKRLLSLIAMIGIIFAVAAPMGAMAADEIVGYEYGGTTDGWAFTDGTASPEATAEGFNLHSCAQKYFSYNTVTDWGNSYTISFDLNMNSYNDTMLSVFFDRSGTSYPGNSNRLNIKCSTSSVTPIINLQGVTNGSSSTVATADLKTAFGAENIFGSGDNKWHMEIRRSENKISVYAKPDLDTYTGDAVEVIACTDATVLGRTGNLVLWAKSSRSRVGVYNLKIVKNDAADYDYNWNGKVDGWELSNGAAPTNNTITANKSNATLADISWGGSTEILCDVESSLYNADVQIDFCLNGYNYYRLSLGGRDTNNSNARTPKLRSVVNGSTVETKTGTTYSSAGLFDKGTVKITCNDGVINAYWYNANESNKEYTLFENVSFDTKYTSGKIRFGTNASTDVKFTNIKINGDLTCSEGDSLLIGQADATMKASTGVLKAIDFDGLVHEAANGTTLSGKMNLVIPVRYAAASGSKAAMVIAAFYDSEGVFISANKLDTSVLADNNWKEVGEEITLPDGTAKVRCFVWNAALVPGYNMSHTN